MNWKRIPSLAALKAFEAVARRGTYVAAADDLNVTEAAMRQHVRGLEAFFDMSLITRVGRRLELTDNGKQLARCVSEGFATLQQGIDELLDKGENRPLKIALTPAFAENWLMPRLGSFWADHPQIEIELAPSLKLVDFKRDGFDVAIRYGNGDWPDCHSRFLASAEYVVVAAKQTQVLKHPLNISDLNGHTWLFEATRTEHQKWAQEHGINFHAGQNKFYPTNSLVLSAVRAGLGLSLQSRALIERDLESGALVEIACEDPGVLGYYVVTRKEATAKQKTFVKWLMDAV